MRVAFVCLDDIEDVKTWSGTPFHMLQAMRRLGVEVESISPLRRQYKYFYALPKLIAAARGYGYQIDRHPLALWSQKRQVESRLRALQRKGKRFDAIFGISSSTVAKLDTGIPVFFWIDALVEGMVGYYGESFSRMLPSELKVAKKEQGSAIERATNVLVASEWAAGLARREYRPPEGKVQVVPFGASLEVEHDAVAVEEFVEARLLAMQQGAPCVLLFIGVDWERKGGALAFEAARLLNEGGIPTTLKVVGCEAPEAPFVEQLGFISKNTAEGTQRLRELFESATFFVLPTRAEAAGVVFCESAAFGLPVISTRTGGVPTYVKDGETGLCLSPEAPGAAYADAVQTLLASPESYRKMSRAAFHRYQHVLNWESAVKRLIEMITEVASEHSR